ncbi:uncharacterized protein Z519_05141 [Cladophialophora bantiana CBS 173.52]|uniref:PEHE domain-containing protein n=1 Tax=Cladophialophora bantiana (strain ATCC 10958 / CBS 173.52 / CDC B-1940 / NIH 8579) TaxID=1442370 RepID=A0A0D2EVG4_CLAB1|nr:uncharacterized protein Z519_05141 [Cladophialophora bantiana CBS 173.52]KIW93826.1 hypothetical protein Z519_05141 [Cladophialophora bantiana CBS 173.52]
MEYPLREQLLTDQNDPLPRASPPLLPWEEAMLQDSNSWAQSFSNLRYGIVPAKKPEEVMAYQGFAEHQLECDPEMTRRYRICLEERKAQYIQQKLEEKRAEIERQRREAERKAMRQYSRQRMALHQQHLAFYTKQYPRYEQLWRRAGLLDDVDVAVAVAREDLNETDPQQLLTLDESIMSSPTYRFVSEHDVVDGSDADVRNFARAYGGSAEEAEEHLQVVSGTVRTRSHRKLQNASQSPRHKTNWPRQHSSELPQTPSTAFTPTASLGEADLDRDMIEDTRLTTPWEPPARVQDEPTPPYHPDDEMLLNECRGLTPQPVQSPTLSDLIGSETPSEKGDDDSDGDGDFDPRSSFSQPPTHRNVKGFGQRNRRVSRRTRR